MGDRLKNHGTVLLMWFKKLFSSSVKTYPLFTDEKKWFKKATPTSASLITIEENLNSNLPDLNQSQLILFSYDTIEEPTTVTLLSTENKVKNTKFKFFNLTSQFALDYLLLISKKSRVYLSSSLSLAKTVILFSSKVKRLPKLKASTLVVNLTLFSLLNITAYQVASSSHDTTSLPKINNSIDALGIKANISKQTLEVSNLLTVPNSSMLSLSQVSAPDSYFQVSSWVPWWSLASGLDSAISHKSSSKDISLFLYNIDKSGNLEIKNKSIPEETIVRRVHLSGEKVYITITEEGNASDFVTMLKNDLQRKSLIEQIVSKSKIYDGVDLDFEALQFSASDQQKKELKILYPEFVAELRDKLHLDGKLLSVTVGARTGREDPNWSVYDYQSLAVVSDQIKVMAYDYHNLSSAPGPLTSKSWIDNILTYMLSSIKPSKITIGLPTYGYRWGSDGSEVALTGEQIKKILLTNNGTITRDLESNTPLYTYSIGKTTYRLFYVDDIFYTSVLQSLRSNNVNQIALWSVGTEDENIWNLFATN